MRGLIFMKILFLIFHGFAEYNGISKKIHYQVDGLKENGHEVSLCYYSVEGGYRRRMINDSILEDFGRNRLAPIKKRICFNSIFQFAVNNGTELVYMRSDHNANPFTIHLVKQLNKHGIKTVMEIPTYPYDMEYKELPLKMKMELMVDKCFRKCLAKYLYKIVTFSDYKTIFGKDTIKISNGIDFSKIRIIQRRSDKCSPFNLIGVAEVHPWHGFDRVIKGLGNYYKNPHEIDVYFHIVGGIEPAQQSIFDGIIKEYGIQRYVIFHGKQFGEELDKLFEQADFGIGSLARHRSGITNIKTLKNREYAARGIPFIYSEVDSDFEEKKYIIKAPADESPIDIKTLINFHQMNILTPEEIRASIEDLSWKNQMKRVIDSIKF